MNAAGSAREVAANDSVIHAVRRNQLVRSAVAVIAQLGAERASIVKIAQHAGVSRGVVNYHFRDLDDLHGAVVAEVYRLGDERLRDPVADAPTAREALLLFVAGSLEFYAEFPDHLAALHAIFTASGRPGRSDDPRHTAELDELAQVIGEGVREGQFRDCDPALMAVTVRAVLDAGRAALAKGADLDHLRTELVASVDALTRKES